MTEKQFYDWQTVGDTDDVMRFVSAKFRDQVWSIAPNGDGFVLRVTTIEGILDEKIRSHSDPNRRQSRRLKDLADIAHLVEFHPNLWVRLPDDLQSEIDKPI